MDNKKILKSSDPSKPNLSFFTSVKNKFSDWLSFYFSSLDPHKTRSAVAYIGKGLLCGAAAFLLSRGECAYSSFPLGAALMCASGSYVLFMYAGLCIGALLNRGLALPLFLGWSFALLFRVAFGLARRNNLESLCSDASDSSDSDDAGDDSDYSDYASPGVKIFGEGILPRMFAAAAGGALIAAFRVISGGFLYYDAFGGLLELLLTPALTFAFACALDRGARHSVRYEAGLAALAFAGIYALRDITFLGFSAAVAVAFIATMAVSRYGGLLRGGVVGLVCGIACHNLSGVVTYAPLLGVAGIAAGAIWQYGDIVSVCAGALCASAGAVITTGFGSLVTVVPDIICGTLVFLPLCRFKLLEPLAKYANYTTVGERDSPGIAERSAMEETTDRLSRMSESFRALSDVFYSLSDRLRKPGISAASAVCRREFEKYCRDCPSRDVCAANNVTVRDEYTAKLGRRLVRSGRVTASDLPDDITEACACLPAILDSINDEMTCLTSELAGRDKSETAATDLKVISKLIDDVRENAWKEHSPDEAAGRRVRNCARNLGLYASNIGVWGERKVTVIAGGIDLARTHASAEEIQAAVGAATGHLMTPPAYAFDGDFITMTMSSTRVISVEAAVQSRGAKGEKLCGDCVATFENKEDYFYSILSDGMGSGREAALASKIMSVILEKMLSAGNPKSASVELAGNYLRAENESANISEVYEARRNGTDGENRCERSFIGESAGETFATLDLLEIDLLSGEATFVKGGAAPSFIIRDGSLYKISANSMPIGITREYNAEEVKTQLEEGDWVVMTSDGVANSFEEIVMLANLLSETAKEGISTEECCERIMRYADDSVDDVSVAVLRIKAA